MATRLLLTLNSAMSLDGDPHASEVEASRVVANVLQVFELLLAQLGLGLLSAGYGRIVRLAVSAASGRSAAHLDF